MIQGALISAEIPDWLRVHFTTVPLDRAIENIYGKDGVFTPPIPGDVYTNVYDFFASYVSIILGELSDYVTTYINESKDFVECDYFVTYQGGDNYIRTDEPSSASLLRAYTMIADAELAWYRDKNLQGFWGEHIPAP